MVRSQTTKPSLASSLAVVLPSLDLYFKSTGIAVLLVGLPVLLLARPLEAEEVKGAELIIKVDGS